MKFTAAWGIVSAWGLRGTLLLLRGQVVDSTSHNHCIFLSSRYLGQLCPLVLLNLHQAETIMGLSLHFLEHHVHFDYQATGCTDVF